MPTIEAPRTQPVPTVHTPTRAVTDEPLVLTPVDRVAMRLGTVLMTRAQRRAAQAARTEQARRSAAAERSAATALDSFDRRGGAGPRWW